eukprot:g423.t1
MIRIVLLDLTLEPKGARSRELLEQRFAERELFKRILSSNAADAKAIVEWMDDHRTVNKTFRTKVQAVVGQPKPHPEAMRRARQNSEIVDSKLMSRTMPNLLSVSSTNTDKNSQPSSRASTPSRLEKPDRPASKRSHGARLTCGAKRPRAPFAYRRSSSRGSKRSSMQSDASASFHRSESSRSDTMPKASATLVAASAALAGPCVQGELMGLPRADAVAALRTTNFMTFPFIVQWQFPDESMIRCCCFSPRWTKKRRVAPWGHQPSLEAAAARLRDTDAEVRREAVLAVAELAPGDRTQAYDLCTWAMEECDWRARAAAVEAMAASASRGGNEGAFYAAADLLEGSGASLATAPPGWIFMTFLDAWMGDWESESPRIQSALAPDPN